MAPVIGRANRETIVIPAKTRNNITLTNEPICRNKNDRKAQKRKTTKFINHTLPHVRFAKPLHKGHRNSISIDSCCSEVIVGVSPGI
jgi:hypothetical protein